MLVEADVTPAEVLGSANGGAANGADTMALTIGSIAQLITFPVTQPCILKARAIVDGQEIRGGTLELLAAGAAE